MAVAVVVPLLLSLFYYLPATSPYVQPPADQGLTTMADTLGLDILGSDPSGMYAIFPEKTSFILERKLTFTANRENGSFTVTIPDNSNTPKEEKTDHGEIYQKLKSFSVEFSQGEEYVNQSSSDGWLRFTGEIPQGKTVVFSLVYNVDSWAVRWDEKLSHSKSGTTKDIPQDLKDQYLVNETLTDFSGSKTSFIAPESLEDMARDITEGETTVYGQVRAIYKYITTQIEYVKSSKPQASSQTLGDDKGDCDDMSAAFVSLTRSLGIPSWLNYGMLAHEKFSSWEAHSWVEIYIPTRDGGHYLAQIDLPSKNFLFYTPLRFQEWSDPGNETQLQTYYNFLTTTSNIDVDHQLSTRSYSSQGEESIKI